MLNSATMVNRNILPSWVSFQISFEETPDRDGKESCWRLRAEALALAKLKEAITEQSRNFIVWFGALRQVQNEKINEIPVDRILRGACSLSPSPLRSLRPLRLRPP